MLKLLFLLVFLVPGCAGLQRASDAAVAPSPALGGQTPVHVIVDGATQVAAGNPAGAIPIVEAISVILSAAAGAAAGHLSGGSKAAKVMKEATPA